MPHNPAMVEKMKRKIRQRVDCRFPTGEGDKSGILEDRAIIMSNPGTAGVPYWDVVDQIRFAGEPELWMRIGYYRQVGEELRWGSQTTLMEPMTVWKRLFVEAAKQKPWFRDLLEEAVREL